MATKKPKYYVVWKGKRPGIYRTWKECQAQIIGVPAAKYRSFESLAEAEFAFKNPDKIKPKERKKKAMYYVVWRGFKPGIYTDWEECKKQTVGFVAPKFQAFGSKVLAEEAFRKGPEHFAGKSLKNVRDISERERADYGEPIPLSLCVDAACSGKTGDFEYRGVITDTGTEVFRVGPYPNGSNNIGEFLALVHGLAYLKGIKSNMPIYSDSKYGIAWVARKSANTGVKDPQTLALVKRAENWLKNNTYDTKILKWPTHVWGEIPADFGRK